jgi:streptogramin lyase
VATLTQWTLPLNPPNPNPFYLQFLTEPRKGRLYYTKYVVDVIGELTVSKNVGNVREWVIPPALFGKASSGNACGITYGPANSVWFALQNGHRLVELDPKAGLFTAFGGLQYPIRYPRHLMFDGADNLWYTGAGTNGALIGRLDRTRTKATYWDLPAELITPEGLWVDGNGEAIWFTPINPNLWLTGAFLARLIPGNNELTYWTYPRAGRRPVNAGVVGDARTNPENIWFTYAEWGPQSRVFRLHLQSNTFFEYAPTFSAPRRVVVDAGRNAWISDWSGKVSRVARDADCGTIRLTPDTLLVERVERSVKSQQATARAAVHSVRPTVQPVTPVKDNCYAHFPLPSPLTSQGIQIDAAKPGKPNVYFTEGSGIVIGRLTP